MTNLFDLKRLITLPLNKVECFKGYYDKKKNEIYLFLGTKNGKLLMYQLSPTLEADKFDKCNYAITQEKSIQVSKKKITKIILIPPFKKIFVLSNYELYCYEMFTFQPNHIPLQLDSIYDFSISSISDIFVRMCFVFKKKLVVYSFDNQKYEYNNEIPIRDIPLTLSFENNFIYMGYKDGYITADIATGICRKFNCYLKSSSVPCTTYTIHNALLVNQDNNMGMYITSDCSPASINSLQWTDSPKYICQSRPFLITLEENHIDIHGMYDQKCIQTIDTSNILFIDDCIQSFSQVLNCEYLPILLYDSQSTVFILQSNYTEQKIRQFMQSNHIDEAIDLCSRVYSSTEYKSKLNFVHIQAGVLLFADMQIEKAFSHFEKTTLDPRDIITLIPEFTSSSCSYKSTIFNEHLFGKGNKSYLDFIYWYNNQHQCVSNSEVDNYVKNNMNILYKCLFSYLYNARDSYLIEKNEELLSAIDTCMVHLYIILKKSGLQTFLSDLNYCNYDDTTQYLLDQQQYYLLSVFFLQRNEPQNAITIWQQLAHGTIKDGNHNGVHECVKYLITCPNKQLILDTASWLLPEFPEDAIHVFTSPSSRTLPIALQVFELIGNLPPPYNEQFVQPYIKHLVEAEHTDNEMFNTLYCITKIDEIIIFMNNHETHFNKHTLLTDNDELNRIRSNFIDYLNNNDTYQCEDIYSRIENTQLYHERITLLGRMGRHDEVIHLLIFDLRALTTAMNYCKRIHEQYVKNPASKKNFKDPYVSLLTALFMEQDPDYRETFYQTGLEVLNSTATTVNLKDLIDILPQSIKLKDILPYLQVSIPAASLHRYNTQVEKSLVQVRQERIAKKLSQVKDQSFLLNMFETCPVCGNSFDEYQPTALLPTNYMCHIQCVPDQFKENYIIFEDTNTSTSQEATETNYQ